MKPLQGSNFFLENVLQSHKSIFGGDSPDVDFTINDNSNAMFSAVEKVFPDAFHANYFVHLVCVNIFKCKKCLHSGVIVDYVIKNFAETAQLRHKIDFKK